MIYDYNNYYAPNKNKNVYAYGNKCIGNLQNCGFIRADTKEQAQTVLKANNKAWKAKNILLNYMQTEIKKELERRMKK